MEIKKITEGGMLSALQIVLGLILIPTGIGYSFYVEMVLPITMVVIYLRCGMKVSGLAGMNTFLILGFVFGNIALAIYAIQALGFGFLTGYVLGNKQNILDDLMIESLIGCAFLLVLDLFTAQLLGHSLLDYDGIDEMVLEIWPDAHQMTIQVFYYLSIAAVPVACVLISYIGSLVLGARLFLLRGRVKKKYYFIKHYKVLSPFAYHGQKYIRYAILGLLVDGLLWPYAKSNYLKAWIACSGAILLYFILLDLSKLIGQYILQRWRKPLGLVIYHMVLLISFVNAFRWTCYLVILIGSYIDVKTTIRQQQAKQLDAYTRYAISLK